MGNVSTSFTDLGPAARGESSLRNLAERNDQNVVGKNIQKKNLKTGVIKFKGYEKDTRRYAIVDYNTSVEDVLKILENDWDLKMPNHLISVTGSAKDFRVGRRLKGAFQRGLMKVVRSSGAWIITGGTNSGVMKEVGKAIRDYELTSKQTYPVVSIGIVTYGVLQQRDKLMEGLQNGTKVQYTIHQDNKTYLDPYHSHFIMVKDGDTTDYGKEIKLRANLEQAVANRNPESTPVVQLVLQGGKNTLETIKQSIEKRIPVVTVAGSGQASDVFAYAYMNLDKSDVIAGIEERLRCIRKLEESSFHEHAVDIKTLIQKNPDLFTVYYLAKSSINAEDIDIAILNSLRKAKMKNPCAQLQLALDFNRMSIAEDIFMDRRNWEDEQDRIHKMFARALEENKVEFVEMFLDQQVNLKKFLTLERLLKLYTEVMSQERTLFGSLIPKRNSDSKELTKKDIDRHFHRLVGYFYRRNAKKNADTSIKNPFKELFIWSILMNRQEMAKLFWKNCKDKTAAALVAFGVLKTMASKTPYKNVSETLKQYASEFADLAIAVLNECFDSSEIRAHQLLQSKLGDWANLSCLELAVGTKNRIFLSQSACQSLLTKMWKGRLSTDNGTLKILGMSMVFGPFTPFLLKYDDKNTEAVTKMTDTSAPAENGGTLSPCEKFQSFYSAPVVVFLHCIISYLLFLVLYSYVLLVDLSTTISPVQYVLFFWVFTICIEEIRQASTDQLRGYFQSRWNIFDIITIMLFILGMTLTFLPYGGMEVARVILGINLMTFFARILQIFSVFQQMGPKLIMISKMFMDLLFFFTILMIFVTGYAIAAHSILYPNMTLSSKNVFYIFKNAYWNLYGELFLEEFEQKEPDCTFDPALYNNETYPRCPTEVGVYVGPLFLGVYVLFSNVLLLNLLIAMFSYSVQKVQDDTYLYWCFMRYFLIDEYKTRPVFPPPLIAVCHVVWLIRCVMKQNEEDTKDETRSEERKWEDVLAENYLQKREIKEIEDIKVQLKELQKRIDGIR